MEPEEIDAAVEAVRAMPDDEARMAAAHHLIRAMLRAIVQLSDIRHFAALALRNGDKATWKYAKFQERLGVRKTDVQEILRGRRALAKEREREAGE